MKIKNHKICLAIIILLVIVIIITLIMPAKQLSTDTYETIDQWILGELTEEDEVIQTFRPEKNYQRIGLPFATYSQIIEKGNVIVTITNDKGKEKKVKIKASSIIDNEYYYIKYNFKKNRDYEVKITFENLDKPITLKATKKEIKNTTLQVNDEEQEGNIILSLMYSENNYFNIWYSIFGITITSSYIALAKERKKHEK
mgnify:FL=1